MRPASTRWELARATPRRCGSPVRTPPSLPGAPTPTQVRRVRSASGRSAAAVPAVLAATTAAGTSGSRRMGTPPRLRPRPSALRESGRRRSHRGRREAARRVREKFVGLEPKAPPRKPAPLKQAGDEA
ncbi:hypothetical protein NN561_016199 [Cricetulus griseus]